MGYWLTAHWPPLQEWAKPPLGVYLADGRQEAGQDLRPGDLVFIYQTKTGKPRKDGKPYRLGREALVFLVRATTRIKEFSEEEREVYKDGTTLWWKWQAKTSLEEYGFCPRQIVCQVLGYNPNYNFRGFGKQHSGLLPLDKTQFDFLYRRFRHRF
jgi:hypothetical protein